MTGQVGIKATLEALSRKLTEQPEKARVKQSSATATLTDGLKCRVVGPSGEHVETDMPVAMGGTASCANPGWYLRASLASCLTTVIAMRAARTGIALTTLEVTIESESDSRGILGLDDEISAAMSNLRATVLIAANGSSEAELEDLVHWADRHAPVGCTVRKGGAMATVLRIGRHEA